MSENETPLPLGGPFPYVICPTIEQWQKMVDAMSRWSQFEDDYEGIMTFLAGRDWVGDLENHPCLAEIIEEAIEEGKEDCEQDCTEQQQQGETVAYQLGYYAALEEHMQIVTDIKCEDGWLWKQVNCEWVKVCALGLNEGGSVPPELEPEDTELRRCNKAYWFVNRIKYVLAEVADALTDSLDVEPVAYAQFLSRNPNLGHNFTRMLNLFNWLAGKDQQAIYATVDGLFNDWFCDLIPRVADTAQYTQQDVDAIGQSIDYIYGSGDESKALHDTFEAITYSQMERWAFEGAYKTDAPCDVCADPIPDPTLAYQWAYKFDFLTDNGGFVATAGFNPTWISGQGWKSGRAANFNRIVMDKSTNAVAPVSFSMKYVKIAVSHAQGTASSGNGIWMHSSTDNFLYWSDVVAGTREQIISPASVKTANGALRVVYDIIDTSANRDWYLTELIIAGNGNPPFPSMPMYRPQVV